VSSALLVAGQYEVIFNQNVRNCAYVATLGDPGFTAVPTSGEIVVAGRATSLNGVFIATRDSTGAASSRAFHLAVFC
jgi:hypothetical protein